MIVASDAAAGRERRRRRRDDPPSRITAAAALLLLLLSAAAAAPAVRAFSAPSNPPSSSSRQHPPPREPLPPFPDPRSPEEAIQNQLYHYRMGELDVAYELYCSPGNKASVGSFNEFERQVTMTPYDLIVGHERADVLLELVNASHGNNGVYGMMEVGDDDEDEEEEEEDEEDEDDEEGEGGGREEGDEDDARILNVACCLVCIRPNKKARSIHPVWFWWEMSLVEETITTTATPIAYDDAAERDGDGSLMYDDFDVGGTNKIAGAASSAASTTAGGVFDGDDVDGGGDEALRGGRRRRARWLVDCISPDFEDLDFEAESLSIEDFMDDVYDDDDEDDDDEGGEYDDITIFLDL
jgi:hypothetical protein